MRPPKEDASENAARVLHRTRRLLIRQHIAIVRSIRTHLAEFGIAPPRGSVELLLQVLADSNDTRLPKMARACIAALAVQSRQLKAQILEPGAPRRPASGSELSLRVLSWHAVP
jgi:transposase